MSKLGRDYLSLMGIDRWELAASWRSKITVKKTKPELEQSVAITHSGFAICLTQPLSDADARLWRRIMQVMQLDSAQIGALSASDLPGSSPGQVILPAQSRVFQLSALRKNPALKRACWQALKKLSLSVQAG
ncbi:MAG TPA: hypothetical protein ENN02_03365 [Halothiobacillus sp.]|nr:hypothetical protein [Halothiobacillus sp.]